MLTEEEARRVFEQDPPEWGPLSISLIEREVLLSSQRIIDGLAEVNWNDNQWTFGMEFLRQGSPKAVWKAADQLRAMELPEDTWPMIVAPYLSEDLRKKLVENQLSALDLSGNIALVVPGSLWVWQTGRENRFPTSRPIQNVYQGKSSLVPRLLLLKPTFTYVQDVMKAIEKKGGEIALSTVSRVLSKLEEELLIRKESEIELLDPEALLDNLLDNYERPQIREKVSVTLTETKDDPIAYVQKIAQKKGMKTAARTSEAYIVDPTAADEPTVFAKDIDPLLDEIQQTPDKTFVDFILAETDDPRIYFDVRSNNGRRVYSPIECYLDMASGGPRSRENAEPLRKQLLTSVQEAMDSS